MNEFKIYIPHNGAKELIGTYATKKETVDLAIADAQCLDGSLDGYWIDTLS